MISARAPSEGTSPPWLRLATIAFSIALLLWLGVEDSHVLPVTLFGATGALLLALHKGLAYFRRPHAPGVRAVALAAVGVLAGGGAALGAAFLMLLKTGLHGHGFPDYPLAQILTVLARAPVWALAGALVGLGLGLAAMARKGNESKTKT